ncbi:MAG: 3-deoxy-7-phosphoheptulonate synthase [Ignisphaera sp.]|nr:3-deoxy-7-phosphoheptulonate synthase [Ignisphaera sp.]MDW8086171.1 3-deoxy-7-phosphoheptulonate synthase [Ignisphaera sp.]
MIFILKEEAQYSSLIEKIRASSASYRVLDLYGVKLVVAWPDSLVEKIDDPSIKIRVRPKRPYQLASSEWKSRTVIRVGDVEIGGRAVVVAAGPCAVESEEQMMEIAKAVKRAGAHLLRGGVFKPRTSPYSFQGLGEEGLKILRRVSDSTNLPVVTELMDVRDSVLVAKYADMIQIGARNAQNYSLLKEVGRINKPILLKRGFATTVEEWILAAEYILLEGNGSVALCERGIRTFEKSTRFTLDLGSVAVAKTLTHLPIAVDPSHPAGRRDLVEPLALAGIAVGADMLVIEVHIDPQHALSDSEQQLSIAEFENLMKKARAVAEAVGRWL